MGISQAWWRNRASADVRAQRTRYSLVLSLRSDDGEVDLYIPISNMIEADIGVEAIVIPTRTRTPFERYSRGH